MSKFLDRFKKNSNDLDSLDGNFSKYPYLVALKPKERYVFRSDYVNVDDHVACVLAFFHDDESREAFSAFWGVNRIPMGLSQDVTTIVLEQVRRMGEGWIDENQKRSEHIERLEEKEQNESGTARTKRKMGKIAEDMSIVAGELQDGASYLHVHDRLFVKAPSLEVLDDAVERIGRSYIELFGTLRVEPYPGEQRQEMSTLFAKNTKKRGKGFHFTSSEFAGSYSLVTNGLNDKDGEYVGYMVGDVNTSANLFNIDRFDHRVVIASDRQHPRLHEQFISDIWGSKIGQCAMTNNKRVVHIVLDGADLDKLGPRFDGVTYRMDMSSGDVNMFEVFGDLSKEESLFSIHLEKLALMVGQLHDAEGSAKTITSGVLKEILTQFYIDYGMWHRNAKFNKKRLRIAGIKHEQVPLLHEFITNIDTKYETVKRAQAKDTDEVRAVNVLRTVFRNMLDSYGDLFDQHTSPQIDGVQDGMRVVYDFSDLIQRGRGVAMAQLVNVIGFAVDSLSHGDVVIIHGAEEIQNAHGGDETKNPVKKYMDDRFNHMIRRGGRVVYLYTDITSMLDDKAFNKFDRADYTVLGTMTDATLQRYQELLNQTVPVSLIKLVTHRDKGYNYLRRGVDNVVFNPDLSLGINPNRTKRTHTTTSDATASSRPLATAPAASASRTTARGAHGAVLAGKAGQQ